MSTVCTIRGRVLSRHLVQESGSLSLHYYIKTANGPVLVTLAGAEYVCFCRRSDLACLLAIAGIGKVRSADIALKNFAGDTVSALYCASSSGFRYLKRGAIDLGIPLFESDIRPEHRFLIERFIALDVEFIGEYVTEAKRGNDGGYDCDTNTSSNSSLRLKVLRASRARKSAVDINLTAISLDIECSFAGELYSVGLYGKHRGKVYKKVIMVGEVPSVPVSMTSLSPLATSEPKLKLKPELESKPKLKPSSDLGSEPECETDTQHGHGHKSDSDGSDCDYIEWVKDEPSLLERLIIWFRDYDPDIIIGWAVVTFDLALLHKRAQLHGIKFVIGRGGRELSWKVADKFRPETLSLPGRVVLDGIDWLKAAFYRFDSFSLEFVSRALLDEGKALPRSADKALDEYVVQSNRGEVITALFNQDKQALAHYNVTDCRLVWDIFEKTQLFEFALERSRLTGLELGRVGGSVAAFNNLYLPHLHRAGLVAPAMATSQGLESPGGYVMDSIPGLYRHIIVLDFKSLYPSIIRTFLIDPKGLVEGLGQCEADTVDGFIGARFSRDAPILPAIVKRLAEHRETAKLQHNAPLSQAIKIIMNSLYGVLGSKGCVFHDARLASSITLRGHQIMKQTRAWIEELGYGVIYGDTDSTFVWLGDNPNDVDLQAQALVAKVNAKWQQKIAADFRLECHLELQYESHFEQFFMPTLRGSLAGSKKRYVGASRNSDGELELTFKGMEQVRSDWSPLARRVQGELYYRLFSGLDVEQFLYDIIARLSSGELDDELIFSKRLRRDIGDYTNKSSPHVKAAQRLCDNSGDDRYGKRGSLIQYIITLNGAEPIRYRQSAIDHQYYIDKQLNAVAEPVLAILGKSFIDIATKQMPLI